MMNLSGSWTADFGQSQLRGPAPAAVNVRIEHSHDRLREEITATLPDGTERRSVLECHIGGVQAMVSLAGRPVRGGVKWEGQELVIELWVDAGNRELHLCDYWSLSPDGRVLTMEHRNDDLAGQKTVFRKVD
jgi:hypothetical protein